MSQETPFGQADLTSCDREEIRCPDSIQPHGCLLVCRDDRDLTVTRASANLAAFLPVPAEDALGRPLAGLLGESATACAVELAAVVAESGSARRRFGCTVHGAATLLHLAAHRVAGGHLVLELEPSPHELRFDERVLLVAHEATAALQQAETMDGLAQVAVATVREISGFDRVMVYRFFDDGSGAVLAEELAPQDREPYLGLRFPASDIPRQARELYRRNRLRLIADVGYRPVPLLAAATAAADGATPPLDMTHSGLRSVSPIHVEYLHNMGVRASMSISVLRRGELWGLIACHHYTPRLLPADLRTACELFGELFSLQLEARGEIERFRRRLRTRDAYNRLAAELAPERPLEAELARLERQLSELVDADGVAICVGKQHLLTGITPSEPQVAQLCAWLRERAPGEIFVTSSLAREHVAAERYAQQASGLLAVPIPGSHEDYLLFFRREVLGTVSWAGNPDKPVEPGAGGRLNPRRSFEAWRQIVRLTARPWDDDDVDAAESLRTGVLELVLRRGQHLERERRNASEQQLRLIDELNHRVKNTLALIRSLVMQTRTGASSLETFTQSLEGRIRALAQAHDLLTAQQWQGTSLRRIIEAEFAPYQPAGGSLFELAGADVWLKPKAVLTVIMVFHELVTNAVKYGALSVPGGKVLVEQTLDIARGGVVLGWRECGGPPVRPSTSRGFGSTVLERSVRFELGGAAELNYEPGGLEYQVFIPSRHLLGVPELALAPAAGTSAPSPLPAPASRQGSAAPRVLLVEDQLMVALDLERMVRQLGYRVVGPAGSLEEAKALAASEGIELALLDINLDDQTVFAAADILAARGVPFCFATAYGTQAVIPAHLRSTPVMSKPYDLAAVRRVLEELLGRSIPPPLPAQA